MKNVKIENACSEKWNEMAPAEKGAFCQVCATNVIDFTNKSSLEIKQLLLANSGNSVCGRIEGKQLANLNTEFEQWKMNSSQSIQRAMIFSLLVVFGLTLFSCTNEKDKQAIQALQTSVSQVIEINDAANTTAVRVSQTSVTSELPQLVDITEISTSCKCDYEVKEPVILEDVILEEYIIQEEREAVIMGGMTYDISYVDFLNQTVQAIEYDENGAVIPIKLAATAYPNPTSDFTTLELGLPEKERVEIGVYDMSGKQLQTIHDGKIERGTSSYSIDLSGYVTGMYLITIRSKKFNETVRVSKL
jgi:hypothetical protein